jgi:amino acid transporter
MGKERKRNKMSKLTKNVISFAIIFVFAALVISPALAQFSVPQGTGLADADLEDTAVNIIKTVLSLLGLIALVIILMGGFKWMTSGGNEEKVGEAKKLLGAGVVGIVIILAAYAITEFVVVQMQTALNS